MSRFFLQIFLKWKRYLFGVGKETFEAVGVLVFTKYYLLLCSTGWRVSRNMEWTGDVHCTGAGELGAGVNIDASENDKKQALYSVNGFNALASDKISLNRSLKDIRHPEYIIEHPRYLSLIFIIFIFRLYLLFLFFAYIYYIYFSLIFIIFIFRLYFAYAYIYYAYAYIYYKSIRPDRG